MSYDITPPPVVVQKPFIPKLGHRKDLLKAVAKIAARGGSATATPAAAAAGPGAEGVVISVPTGGPGGEEDTSYSYVLLRGARVGHV